MGALRLGLAGAAGYLLGAFPSADLASRAATRGAIDLRDHGSGNPGAANAAQVLGSGWGSAVLAADLAKGALAGAVGRGLARDGGGYLAATTAIAGHCWPVWSGFRGGKGVATSAGACVAVFPAYAPVDVAVAGVAALRVRHAERAIWVAAPVWVLSSVLWWRRDLPNAWGPRPSRGLVAFATAGAAMVLSKFARARSAP